MHTRLFLLVTLLAAFVSLKAQTPEQFLGPGLQPVEGAPGWYVEPTLGLLYGFEGTSWFYQYDTRSFLHIENKGAEIPDYFLYYTDLGWAFINPETFPWLYFYGQGGSNQGGLTANWAYSYGLASKGQASPHTFRMENQNSDTSVGLEVEIVNNSTYGANDVYVTAVNFSSNDGKLPDMKSKPLSGISNNIFHLTTASSARLAFSYGAGLPSNQSDFPLASNARPRYDKMEITYASGQGVANLTSVDFVAIPMKLETFDSSGKLLDTRTFFKNINTLRTALKAVAPKADRVNDSDFMRFISPKTSLASFSTVQDAYATFDQMIKYGRDNSKSVTIDGLFYGNSALASPYDEPANYSYSGTFNNDAGSLTLTGSVTTIDGSHTYSGSVVIPYTTSSSGDLSEAIYSGEISYFNVTGDPNKPSTNNDAYTAVFRDLVTGFDSGYVFGNYGDNSSGWWGKPAYAAARPKPEPAGLQGANVYDVYSEIITNNSQSYSYSFSDVGNDVQIPLTTNVQKLRITLLADDFLNAPTLKEPSCTKDQITVSWDRVSGASDYQLTIFPKPTSGSATAIVSGSSHTFAHLISGTPYQVTVVARKKQGKTVSEISPPAALSCTTTGATTPVTGTYNVYPTFFFLPGSAGYISFNGSADIKLDSTQAGQPSQTFAPGAPKIPASYNAAIGNEGENVFVVTWKDLSKKVIFESSLVVSIDGQAPGQTGFANITSAYLVSNQTGVTIQSGAPWNLSVSIQPIE